MAQSTVVTHHCTNSIADYLFLRVNMQDDKAAADAKVLVLKTQSCTDEQEYQDAQGYWHMPSLLAQL